MATVTRQPIRDVKLSMVLHIRSVFSDMSWDVSVVEGWLDDNPDSRPPVIAVVVPDWRGNPFELGNSKNETMYNIEIETQANTGPQLDDIMFILSDNMSGIDIIEFNTAMPGDGGYNAVTQKVSNGRVVGEIESREVDMIEHGGRVHFWLRESKPRE